MNIDDLFKFDVSAIRSEVENGRIGDTYRVKLIPKMTLENLFGIYAFEYSMLATKIAHNDYRLSNADLAIFSPFGYLWSGKIDLDDMLKKYEEGTLRFTIGKSSKEAP